jgi:hypothetical protein
MRRFFSIRCTLLSAGRVQFHNILPELRFNNIPRIPGVRTNFPNIQHLKHCDTPACEAANTESATSCYEWAWHNAPTGAPITNSFLLELIRPVFLLHRLPAFQALRCLPQVMTICPSMHTNNFLSTRFIIVIT